MPQRHRITQRSDQGGANSSRNGSYGFNLYSSGNDKNRYISRDKRPKALFIVLGVFVAAVIWLTSTRSGSQPGSRHVPFFNSFNKDNVLPAYPLMQDNPGTNTTGGFDTIDEGFTQHHGGIENTGQKIGQDQSGSIPSGLDTSAPEHLEAISQSSMSCETISGVEYCTYKNIYYANGLFLFVDDNSDGSTQPPGWLCGMSAWSTGMHITSTKELAAKMTESTPIESTALSQTPFHLVIIPPIEHMSTHIALAQQIPLIFQRACDKSSDCASPTRPLFMSDQAVLSQPSLTPWVQLSRCLSGDSASKRRLQDRSQTGPKAISVGTVPYGPRQFEGFPHWRNYAQGHAIMPKGPVVDMVVQNKLAVSEKGANDDINQIYKVKEMVVVKSLVSQDSVMGVCAGNKQGSTSVGRGLDLQQLKLYREKLQECFMGEMDDETEELFSRDREDDLISGQGQQSFSSMQSSLQGQQFDSNVQMVTQTGLQANNVPVALQQNNVALQTTGSIKRSLLDEQQGSHTGQRAGGHTNNQQIEDQSDYQWEKATYETDQEQTGSNIGTNAQLGKANKPKASAQAAPHRSDAEEAWRGTDRLLTYKGSGVNTRLTSVPEYDVVLRRPNITELASKSLPIPCYYLRDGPSLVILTLRNPGVGAIENADAIGAYMRQAMRQYHIMVHVVEVDAPVDAGVGEEGGEEVNDVVADIMTRASLVVSLGGVGMHLMPLCRYGVQWTVVHSFGEEDGGVESAATEAAVNLLAPMKVSVSHMWVKDWIQVEFGDHLNSLMQHWRLSPSAQLLLRQNKMNSEELGKLRNLVHRSASVRLNPQDTYSHLFKQMVQLAVQQAKANRTEELLFRYMYQGQVIFKKDDTKIDYFVMGTFTEQVNLPYSTADCVQTNVDPERNVCYLRNIIQHQGQLYYIAPNYTITAEQPRGGLPEMDLTSGRTCPDDGYLKGDSLQVITQDKLPFEMKDAQWKRATRGMVWQPIHYYNFYHYVLENGPIMHANLCRYFGQCSFGDQKNSTKLFILTEKYSYEQRISIFEEVMSCYFDSQPAATLLKHLNPPHITYPEQSDNTVHTISTLLMGYGNTRRQMFCGGPDIRQIFIQGMQPLPPGLALSFKQRVGQCLGVKQPLRYRNAAQGPPVVGILNRSGRRAWLQVDESISTLKQRFAADISSGSIDGVTVVPEFVQMNFDDLPLKEQVQQVAKLDVMVMMHGASNGHYIFMPLHSAWIEQLPYKYPLLRVYSASMMLDFPFATPVFHVNTTDWSHVKILNETLAHEVLENEFPEEIDIDHALQSGEFPGIGLHHKENNRVLFKVVAENAQYVMDADTLYSTIKEALMYVEEKGSPWLE